MFGKFLSKNKTIGFLGTSANEKLPNHRFKCLLFLQLIWHSICAHIRNRWITTTLNFESWRSTTLLCHIRNKWTHAIFREWDRDSNGMALVAPPCTPPFLFSQRFQHPQRQPLFQKPISEPKRKHLLYFSLVPKSDLSLSTSTYNYRVS